MDEEALRSHLVYHEADLYILFCFILYYTWHLIKLKLNNHATISNWLEMYYDGISRDSLLGNFRDFQPQKYIEKNYLRLDLHVGCQVH